MLAVVCAARGRSMLAAVVLGLAIGTSSGRCSHDCPPCSLHRPGRGSGWELSQRRSVRRSRLSAPLADWHDYREKAHTLGRSTTVSHYSAWTGVSRPVDIVVPGFDGPVTIHRLPAGLSREDISLMIPVACTILVLAFARRRRCRLTEEDAVALLAISFLLRVTLDSTVLLYYFAPKLMQTRTSPQTLQELAARVEEIAGGAPAGGQPAPGTRREIGSVSEARARATSRRSCAPGSRTQRSLRRPRS